MAIRQSWLLVRRRAGYLWKVVRGRHTLTDAIYDLSIGRATAAVWGVCRAGWRLRRLQWQGGSALEVEVRRVALLAEVKSLERRIETNDFYQDSEPYLKHPVMRPRRVREPS
jgi:hypothetical protein